MSCRSWAIWRTAVAALRKPRGQRPASSASADFSARGSLMTSLEVILAAAGAVQSRAIGYPLRTADDRRAPQVVAHEWPGGRRLFE